MTFHHKRSQFWGPPQPRSALIWLADWVVITSHARDGDGETGARDEGGGRQKGWDILRVRRTEEGKRSRVSKTGVIDSMLPSVAPFRRDRTSNKARLTTLFNKGCARSSLFHSFISPLPPVLPRVTVSSLSFFFPPHPHLIIPIFHQRVKSAPHRKSQITHRRAIHFTGPVRR